MKTRTRALLLAVRENRETIRFNLNVVVLDPTDGKPRNGIDDLEIYDLEINAVGNNDKGGDRRELYGYWTGYNDAHYVGLSRATAMARALRRVDRTLANDYRNLGNATDFAEYVMRVARALKIEVLVERVGPDNGSSYLDNEYLRLELSVAGIARIRELEAGWKGAGAPAALRGEVA